MNLLLLLLIAYIVVWAIRELHFRKERNWIKGPFPYPVLYSVVQSLTWGMEKRPEMFAHFFESYGDSYVTRTFAGPNIVATRNPDCIRHFTLANFDNYIRQGDPKLFGFKMGKLFLGDGIFFVDGEAWAFQRQVAAPMFKKTSLDDMKPVFREKGRQLLKNLEEVSGEFDIQHHFFQYTMDSFGQIGFGIEKFDDQVPFHFDRAQRLLLSLFIKPWARYTSILTDYMTSVEFLHSHFDEVIKKHPRGGADLLSKFMSLTDQDGNPYPRKWIREILINFLIAGRDTTALLLTWSTYMIVSHPEVYKKIAEENIRVLGDGDVTEEKLAEMKYLKYCLKETLRLYPSVPLTTRSALKDDIWPDGTIVKGGDRVVYHQYQLHRNSKYWDNPNDFIPERWSDKHLLKHPFQFTPFHAGPMSCLGQHMAMIEAQTMSALLFQKFDLKVSPNQNIVPFYGLVMPAMYGIKFTAKLR